MLLGLFVCLSLFCHLLSKSLILALGYGTDCTFHLYDIGQSHVKQQKKIAIKDSQVEKISEPKVKH